jgi:hypothetical protein
MNQKVYGWYSFVARPPVLVLLLAAFFGCMALLELRRDRLGCGIQIPDSQWSTLTSDQLKGMLAAMGEDGRQLYALSEWTLDFVFPLIYCSLFAGFLAQVYPVRAARVFLSLPVAAAVCDLVQNYHFAHLACHFNDFDNLIASWYWTAVIFTVATWAFAGLAGLALIVGAIGNLLGWWKADASPG